VPHNESPRIFRLLIQATNLDESRRFYESLLDIRGRGVAPGRIYFDCGDVILGILDYSATGKAARSTPTEALYLATDDIDGVHRRAKKLRALSRELIHGDPAAPAGEIMVRPWGERSFYAVDPSGNPLCFVDALTLFTGTPAQIARLNRSLRVPAVTRAASRARRSNSRPRTRRMRRD
jgi:catechol 2,3-dioxygenase-like lactoylglutathione lyase family enzyme